MKISVITLFPEVFEKIINSSIILRAQNKGLVEINLVNHRDFGTGKHKVVDDKSYGGGPGMLLKADVLIKAIKATKLGVENEKIVLLDPQGKKYEQQIAEEFAHLEHLILICGHYEGFDERIRKYVDFEVSMGDFVLTGGEIPAMAIIDSVTRLIPNVLKDPSATKNESFSKTEQGRILEGAQYTRPLEVGGVQVPQEYLSGDPKKVSKIKKETAIDKTQTRRPDLLKKPTI